MWNARGDAPLGNQTSRWQGLIFPLGTVAELGTIPIPPPSYALLRVPACHA